MNIIENNPFRIFGVPSNASAKEIAASQSKLKAYMAASKKVSFPLDSIGGMPPVIRNADFVGHAAASINLLQDRLKHALFWFIKPEDSIGSMAWDYLLKGDTAKAIELFSKRETIAALLNQGVLAFLSGNNVAGINSIGRIIHDDGMRRSFVCEVTDDAFQISEDDLAELFFSTIFTEVDAFAVFQNMEGSASPWTMDHVRKYSIQKPFAFIEDAIAKAKSTKGEEPKVWWEAGKELSNSTHRVRLQLIGLVGEDDNAYMRLADKLANQILQCSINYFNNSDESRVNVLNAKKLAEYSSKVAKGKLIKDRCDEAVKVLNQKEKDLPPEGVEQEAKDILRELKDFCQKPDKIEHSVALLNNTKPKLQAMKTKLGATNSYYLKMSSQVVNNALHNVIAEVNVSQETLTSMAKEYPSIGSLGLDLIRPTFKAAWAAIQLMDQFDLEESLKDRYNNNRNTLKNLCNQIGISTSVYRPSANSQRSYTSSSSYSQTSSSSSSSDDFWENYGGCLIQILIYGFIAICVATCS